MKWKEFNESKKEYPEKVVEDLIEGFSTATKGKVELYVTPLKDTSRIQSRLYTSFQFGLYLSSQYVDKYKLNLFNFGYDVELWPVRGILEEDIHNEIFDEPQEYGEYLIYDDKDDLISTLHDAFDSERFVSIVEGLIKLANKNPENT